MCSAVDFYVITGTEQGIPLGSCQDQIVKLIKDNAGHYAAMSFLYTIIGLLGLLISIASFYMQHKQYVPDKFYKYSKWGI